MALRKWSMPVVHTAGGKRLRFSELETAFPDATALALKELRGAGLVERALADETPPRTPYQLSARGRRLARLAEEAAGDSSKGHG